MHARLLTRTVRRNGNCVAEFVSRSQHSDRQRGVKLSSDIERWYDKAVDDDLNTK